MLQTITGKLYRFSINRILLTFFVSSTLLVAVYLVFNLTVTRQMKQTVHTGITLSETAGAILSLQTGLFRMERNIQQYLRGLIRLSRTQLARESALLQQEAERIRRRAPAAAETVLDRPLQVISRHIRLIETQIHALDPARDNPGLMKQLNESFFLCDHLLTRIAAGITQLDLNARHKLRRATDSLTLQLILLVTVALLLALSATLLRRLLQHKLDKFAASLRIEPEPVKTRDPADTYPYTDEFTPVITGYREMADAVTGHLKEIRYLKNYLRNIIESMPSMLVSVDAELRVTHWNATAAKTTGIPAEQALGKLISELLPGAVQYRELFQQVLEQREPVELVRQQNTAKEGAVYNMTAFPLVANGVRGMVLRLDDITEAEQKEAQLRRAQKMETVGNLAGGLAHDFNNILAIIVGSVSLMRHQLQTGTVPDRSSLEQFLSILEESAGRASDMVEQLLTLSRRQEISLAPVDLNLTVKHVIKLCRNTLSKDVSFQFTPYPGTAVTEADPAQLEQVVLNLCINAAHAMTFMRNEGEPPGGEILISIEEIEPDPIIRRELIHGNAPRYWLLSVKDTGVGIPHEHLERIFEPFFTTKQKNGGTGLGLAMVYNIIKQHRGHVNVYSEPGTGSSFNIYLPCTGRRLETAPQKTAPALPAGHGTILVIDDEPVMRQMARSMLETCGYTVLIAENGLEGIELYRNNRAQIRLVVLDLVMPGISGLETFSRLKSLNPEITVVMSSGFKKDERVQQALDSGVRDFIAKPYTLQRLGETLHRILGD